MKQRILVYVLLVMTLLIVDNSDAYAKPRSLCWGAGCNLGDPVSSGCAGSSSTYTAISKWATATSGTVRMDLKYAPACNANWTRGTNENPGAVRKLKAELWNSALTSQITSYQSSSYVYLWSAMYNGSTVLCGRGKQGPANGTIDATTAFGCA